MDVLVVAGDANPGRLTAKAGHIVATPDGALSAQTIADLRARIPRTVVVIGPHAEPVALTLHKAGLPVTVATEHALSDVLRNEGIEAVSFADKGPAMDVSDSFLDMVGNTPLVRLDRVARDVEPQVLAKCEMLNPGGSVKDRIALIMVEAAERDGLLKPGGTIVEPTSGNTGVGLAIVAARKRYRCVFTMPDKMSQEKISLLRAYGAEVVVCPTAVAPEHPDSYYSVASRLSREIPGAFQPNQYANPNNPKAHELTTGPEIWRQTAGRITHFVAGVGTGGTISGTSRYLKARNPSIQVIGADPEGSVYSGGGGRPYLVEGVGEDFWPKTYDPATVDRIVPISDRESFLMARRVTREEGILIGGSAGLAVAAALTVAREAGPDDVIVVLLPDSGRGYLSKIYNDEWMADYGFVKVGGTTVSDLLTRKSTDVPSLVHIHPDETVRAAIALMREFNVSQVPVVKAEPPLNFAEVAGAVQETSLLEKVFTDQTLLDRPIGESMDPPLPAVGAGEAIDVAVAALENSHAVLVVDAGHPIGIVTRSDVLDFLSKR